MKKLSIVTTVYKKGNLAVQQLRRLVSFIKRNSLNAEIIVVIDGEVGKDKEIINTFVKRNRLGRSVKVYSYLLNRGKGYAQRYGFKKSTGDVILFVDADTDIRMKSVNIAFDTFMNNFDSVDALYPSKYHKDADLDGTNSFRKFLSLCNRKLTFFMLGTNKNIDDAACGLKIFKRKAYNLFEKNLFVDRFATDAEVYFWVNKLNLRVLRVPFYMNAPKNSTSVSIYEITKMIMDITGVAIKLRFNSIFLNSKIRYEYLQSSQPIV